MWVFRELLPLVLRVAFAVALAVLFAGLWALIKGGDFTRNAQIMFFLLGVLFLLFGAVGNRRSLTARRVNWGIIWGGRIDRALSPAIRPRPGEPTLTVSAVFICSAAVLFILGAVV